MRDAEADGLRVTAILTNIGRGADPSRRLPITASLRSLVAAGGIALLFGGAGWPACPAKPSRSPIAPTAESTRPRW
jgi:hypothetical protein